jgi:hypothetical protein
MGGQVEKKEGPVLGAGGAEAVQLPALGEEALAETASGATPAAADDSPAGRSARRVSR